MKQVRKQKRAAKEVTSTVTVLAGGAAAKEPQELLTTDNYLQLARNFLWVVNEHAIRDFGAGKLDSEAAQYRTAIHQICDAIGLIDNARPSLARLELDGSSGVPPSESLQKLARIILACKGTGWVTIGASAFSCAAAK